MAGIIVTGMHRSGTSLFSKYLMTCGINMGERLLEADRGNPLGYYEDLEIVQFHDKVLKRNGCGYFFDRFPKICLNDEEIEEAKHIASNSVIKNWKDPKTILFLDYWSDFLPNDTKYIFLYRDPVRVSDSLIRRRTDKVINQFPHLAIQNWYIYNKLLYRFTQKISSEKYLIINIDNFLSNFVEQHRIIVDFLGSMIVNSDIKLTSFFHTDHFKKNIEKTSPMSIKSKILYSWYRYKSYRLFKKLEIKL
ncbi:MAG TPA: hypothetical protein DDX98_08415 [Bacteroidales bacterium]|jgi:hypothetical protein|nr:hypothetical protein [Bacteroidales bacterium]